MEHWSKYSKLIDKYSAFALKLVVIGLIVLLLLQILLQIDAVRSFIVPTEHWEGRPLLKP